MRRITKPSTACCDKNLYMGYLLSDPQYANCTRLSEVMGDISHDSVNRFLEREDFEPRDMFNEVEDSLELNGGVLSVDDTVLDKPYSDPKKAAYIDMFWSGKHKRVVKGINLITLFYTDIHGMSVPVNYRLYKKDEGKTKNDYFLEMLLEVNGWGIKPTWVTGDSWYSSLQNLKFIRKQKLNFMFGIEGNRRISAVKGQYIQIQKLEDWENNMNTVYLKDYGMVKVFRQEYKKTFRYYIMSTFELDNLVSVTFIDFKRVHDSHWHIERYHRALKQVCNIEKFQVRKARSIATHIFCSISAFVELEIMRIQNKITNWYQAKRELIIEAIRKGIVGNMAPIR